MTNQLIENILRNLTEEVGADLSRLVTEKFTQGTIRQVKLNGQKDITEIMREVCQDEFKSSSASGELIEINRTFVNRKNQIVCFIGSIEREQTEKLKIEKLLVLENVL